MAKTIRDSVADMAARMRTRQARTFEEEAAQLEAAHQPVVAAHLGFALLHMALVGSYAELIKQGIPAELIGCAPDVTLRVLARRATCRFTIQAAVIEIWLTIDGTDQNHYETWTPPPVFDNAALYDLARAVVERAIAFLLGE